MITITKETLLEQFRDVMELIKAESSLQDDNLREKDKKAIEGLIKEIDYLYQLMNGDEDYDLKEARNELDDLLKEKEEDLGIYESVGFKETISDGELDTLMGRLVDSMLQSGELAVQINSTTEERLDAPYGKYQDKTEKLKELNDKKIELDNVSKPAVIKATKSIAELYEKSKKEYEESILKISERQTELVKGQEQKRKESFEANKQKMVEKYAKEMEKHAKLAYASQGEERAQHTRDYKTSAEKYNQALNQEFKSYPQAYDEMEKEKQELIEKQNKTRSKYAEYIDFLSESAAYLGIQEEFLKYKPTISAPIGKKREEPYNKADGPVIPDPSINPNRSVDPSIDPSVNPTINSDDPSIDPSVNPTINSDDPSIDPSVNPTINSDDPSIDPTNNDPAIGDINPDDVTYHLTKDQIIQDDLANPNGNNGNNGNNGGDPGSTRTTGADEPGIDVPINPTGKNGKGDNPNGPTDTPLLDDPNNPKGSDDPNDPNSQNGEDEPEKNEDENEQDQPLPKGKVKIFLKEKWDWIKEHPAKAALIGVGIASLIYLIAHVAPLLVAAAKYGAVKGMFVNGGKWAAADAITKGNLHAGNVMLSKIVGKGSFDLASGVWTFGGKSIEATAAALGEQLGAASIKAAAGHYGAAILAGAGALGANSLLHSKEFKEYSKRICAFKKADHKSQVEAAQIANELKNEIHADERLKSSDKDTLIKRINNAKRKIDNRLDKTIGPVDEPIEYNQPQDNMSEEDMLKEAIGMLQAQGMSEDDIQAMIGEMLKAKQAAA